MRNTAALGMHEVNEDVKKKGTPLSQNIVRTSLMSLGIAFRKTEHGEFRVNLLRGKEATAYYTDDLADALATGKLMAKRANGERDAET
jgi:hypothetical protein